MSGEFIDSNVFVYLFDETDPGKQKTAESLVHGMPASGAGSISFQVVQETINGITRKFASPASADDARRFLDNVLAPLWRIMPGPALYHRGLDIKSRYGYSFYDALIVAAVLEAGCTRLYSEDLQHGQKIEGLTIEDPFRSGK